MVTSVDHVPKVEQEPPIRLPWAVIPPATPLGEKIDAIHRRQVRHRIQSANRAGHRQPAHGALEQDQWSLVAHPSPSAAEGIPSYRGLVTVVVAVNSPTGIRCTPPTRFSLSAWASTTVFCWSDPAACCVEAAPVLSGRVCPAGLRPAQTRTPASRERQRPEVSWRTPSASEGVSWQASTASWRTGCVSGRVVLNTPVSLRSRFARNHEVRSPLPNGERGGLWSWSPSGSAWTSCFH
jgi:hypothetical protein